MTEREKYEAVWEHDAYRKVSPGEREVERAFARMGCVEGESLNDFGAGTGRATLRFADKGLRVLAIDIADNALDEIVPFYRADLSEEDLPGRVPAAEYGFCCDVLEHIPPHKLHAVLCNLRALTTKAAWLRIATRPDVMGARLIGRPLHLNVRPGDWWTERLRGHWGAVETVEDTGRDVIALCRP